MQPWMGSSLMKMVFDCKVEKIINLDLIINKFKAKNPHSFIYKWENWDLLLLLYNNPHIYKQATFTQLQNIQDSGIIRVPRQLSWHRLPAIASLGGRQWTANYGRVPAPMYGYGDRAPWAAPMGLIMLNAI